MFTTTDTKPDGTPHLFTHIFRTWRWAGFWTLHGLPDHQTPRSYIVYSAFIHIFLYCAFVGSMVVRMMHCRSIAAWTEDFPVLPVTDAAFESLLMYLQRHRMAELLTLSHEMDTHVRRGDQRRRIARQVSTSTRISFALFSSYAGMTTMIAVVAVVSSDRQLVFPAHFPIDWHTRWYLYIALVLHQLAALYVAELVMSSRDMFGPGMNKVLTSHLVVLGEQLEV